MRHHERIRSLISLGLDGGVIGFDGGGMAARCEGAVAAMPVSGDGGDDECGAAVKLWDRGFVLILGFNFKYPVCCCLHTNIHHICISSDLKFLQIN